jgi:predicted dinucleotide-binding enzyme
MKVGIIGSGIVGRVLGKAFLAEGHSVMLGSRDTGKVEVVTFLNENPTALIGNFEQSASFGEIVVLAVGGGVAIEAINLAGKSNFSGKLLIDATNPIAPAAPVNGVLQFFTNYNQSLMEQIQAHLPEAKLVKAFSCVGNALMYKPKFDGIKPTMFIAGNDEGAKKIVTGILTSFGWETEDMGNAEAARAIEPLCILWCIPGFLHNHWNHAFKLLKS